VGWLIRGGRIVDPVTGTEETSDIAVLNDRIVPRQELAGLPVREVDARGRVVVPGLIDLHVHFREPGDEEAETVASGARAAARGGFATVVLMPNTQPPADTPERIGAIAARAAACRHVRALPAGCITRGRSGKELADLAALASAGAVAFTDDGTTPGDTALLHRAMEIARDLGVPILDHALDPVAAARGVMHAGARSAALKLPGIPAEAEVCMVKRDIELCEKTGCRVHIQHVSCAESVALVRQARAAGLRVSAEVTPHHLALTDEMVVPTDANFKMLPPLRTEKDRAALLEAVAEGTVSALASDHAPHRAAEKARGFLAAPPGVVGLETAVGVTYTLLVRAGRMSLMEWLRRWTTGPAEILGHELPSLRPGALADFCVLDLENEWIVQPQTFLSKSRNTPFGGWRLIGRAVCTFHAGIMTWSEQS